MMGWKIPLPVLLALWLAGTATAAADSGLGPIRWEGDTALPEVAETGRVVAVEDEHAAPPPADSFAAQATRPGVRFLWRPSPDFNRVTGGAMLVDAALSPDGGTVLLLERVGRKGGPFGSRIVLFCPKAGRIINVWSYPDRKLTQLLIPDDGERVFALQEAQPELKQATRLLSLSLPDGEIAEESEEWTEMPGDTLYHDGFLWVKDRDGTGLRRFAAGDLTEPGRRFELRESGGLLAAAPEGGLLFHLNAAGVDEWRLANGELQWARRRKVTPGWSPTFLVALGGTELVAGEAGGDTCYWLDEDRHRLSERSGNCAVWNPKKRLLFLSLEKNDAVGLFRLPERFAAESVAETRRLAPRNTGEVLYLFAAEGENAPVWVVDHRGNLFSLELKGRRWSKTMLYSPSEE